MIGSRIDTILLNFKEKLLLYKQTNKQHSIIAATVKQMEELHT